MILLLAAACAQDPCSYTLSEGELNTNFYADYQHDQTDYRFLDEDGCRFFEGELGENGYNR